MGNQQHNINIVVSEHGLTQVGSAFQNFANTSTTVVKSQDALAGAMGKTQGAAIKTGQEFENVDKAETKTVKTTGTLGQAFKNSALQLTAFVSGLISTVMQVNSVLAAENKLDKQRELLNKKTIALEAAELKYNTGLANGTLTGEKARIAAEKLDSMRNILSIDTEKLSLKEQAHTASLTQLALSAIPTVISGASSVSQIYSTLSGVVETATTTVDENAESFDGLGTAANTATTTGLIPTLKQILAMIPGVGKLTQIIGKKGDTGDTAVGGWGALSFAMSKNEKDSNIVIESFKKVGSAVNNFFNNMAKDVGKSEGFMNKLGASFKSFFGQLGTGFKDIGGKLKELGSGILDFGKKLGSVFMNNPILFLISAIATAILGLVFNLGGFRDRVNEAGVALGKMVPILKPLLDGLGFISQKLGELGDYLMGTKADMEAANLASIDLALAYDVQYQALSRVIEVGEGGKNLKALVAIFDGVKVAVDNLSDAGVKYSTTWKASYDTVNTVWTAMKHSIKDTGTDTQNVIKGIDFVLKAYNDTTMTTAEAQKVLTYLFGRLNQTTDQSVESLKTVVAEEFRLEQQSTQLTTTAYNVVNAMQATEEESEAVAASLTDQEAAMIKLLAKYGIALPTVENLTQKQKTMINEISNHLPVFEKYGNLIHANADGTINWDVSIKNIAKSHDDLKNKGTDAWNKIRDYLAQGVEGYKLASVYVQVLGEDDKATGEMAAKYLQERIDLINENQKELSDFIDDAIKGGDKQTDVEKKVQEETQKSADKIKVKAEQLKIWDDILNLSAQDQENAIKITEKGIKTDNESRLKLQELAVARGLDLEAIGQESGALLAHIKNSQLEAVTLEDVHSELGILEDKRQKEAKAAELQTQVQTQLLAEMGKVPPLLGMTGKGLESLVKIYRDTANAQEIATDTIGLWWAELEKAQIVEKEELKALEELAFAHQVTIPEAIKQKGIPAIKEYLAEVTGMADTTEESAKRMADAFDEIAGKAQEGLADLIQEDLIEGDFDKVIEKIEETGRSLEQLSVQSVVIKPLLETVDFEDDLTSLTELMGETWAEADLEAKSGGDAVMQSFFDGLLETHGSEIQPLITTMDSVWTQISRENPNATGNELVALFMKAMDKPSEIERLTNSLAQSGGKGFESGGHYFATAGEKAMYELLNSYDKGKAESYAAGHEIGAQTGKGIESSKSIVQNATLGYIVDPITGEIKKIPTNAKTELQPVPGIFSQAFLDASNQGGAQLATMVTLVHTKMQSMSLSVATYSNSMSVNLSAFVDEVVAKLPELDTATVATHEAFSALSTSIATYASSMTTNIGNWLLTTSEGFKNYDIILLAVQQTFSDLSMNIDTYTLSITENITAWLEDTTTLYDEYMEKILELQKTFSDLSKNVDTYMQSMTKNIEGFATDTETAFGQVSDAAWETQGDLSDMSTSVDTYMRSMTVKVNSFADACVTAFGRVATAAGQAETKVKDLQAAINALKDKTVTITTRYVTQGSPGRRFGGSAINYARGGNSWVQDKPANVGGVNVGEFSKPELITVTPLTNPYDVMDKSIDLGGSVGKGGGGSPVIVTGDLHVVVQTQSGEVLATQVKPYLLKGFSGIT